MILRKQDRKWFGQKISIFGFQRKYVGSIASNILMQIFVSSDDSMSNYNEKYERYTTNRNHTQSYRCSCQTRFLSLQPYNHLPSNAVLSALIAGPYSGIHYQAFVWAVWIVRRSILENFKKYFLEYNFGKFENFFGKFWEIFRKN